MEKQSPFLRYVAQDLLSKYGHDLSEVTLVFPNKRASLFLNEHLISLSSNPIWSPKYTTISEMLQSHSPLVLADDIKLICDLHKSFNHCTGGSESLDQFYGWGTVLLSDFNDIDKCMANASQVFANLRDLHAYDSVDYLSDAQVAILKQFFQTFDERHNSRLKEKFLQLWNHFGDVYTDFNQRLRSQGLAYEGALCREVVSDKGTDFGKGPYMLVGFNALLEVERHLFRRLKRESEAHFYWDFDNYYFDGDKSRLEAGTFIEQALREFRNELDGKSPDIYDNMATEKHITYIGAPTSNIQARYVGEWLAQEDRVKAGNRSAIVMCEETLLPTIVHSIPPTVSNLNITTGFPLTHTTAASLVTLLLELHLFGTRGNRYRQKFVNAVLRHPYAVMISDKANQLNEELVEKHRYYPTREELARDEGLELLFSDLTKSSNGKTYNEIEVVNTWLLGLLRRIAIEAREPKFNDPLTQESIFRVYTLLNRLQTLVLSGDLVTDKTTFFRLIKQVISTTRVPYHGEPAIGLQVMGVLETRNLDFEHLLLLSCNEGSMPKGTESTSFIPQTIRKAFGLSTIDYSEGLYAYYFYRMIQRAKDVTIMYVNAADNKNTGEMSRFMLQLLVESGKPIDRCSIHTEQKPTRHEKHAIAKNREIMDKLHGMRRLTPTAINRYVRCGLQFFYNLIAGIEEPEDNSDKMDNRTFGTIFHDASQFIYEEITGVDMGNIPPWQRFLEKSLRVEKSQIENALKSPDLLERVVDKAFCLDFFKVQEGEHPEYDGLQMIHRNVIKQYLKQLLTIDKNLAPFTIRGLEGDVETTIKVTTSEGEKNIRVGGRIDRMDEVNGNDDKRRIRVIDYKTGSKNVKALKNIDEVFSREKIHDHSDYYLQTMLYSWIVSQSIKINPDQLPVSPALLFIQHAGVADYSPVLKFEKNEILDMRDHNDDMERKLGELIGEIYEPEKPFEPTDDPKTCQLCCYKQLCGRLVREQNPSNETPQLPG